MNYIYKKEKDIHFVKNNELLPITIIVEMLQCGNYEKIRSFELGPNKECSLYLEKLDGQYRISLSDGVEITFLLIESYFNAERYIVELINSLVCGCNKIDKCGCFDSSCEEEEAKLSLLSVQLGYIFLQKEHIKPFIRETQKEFECLYSYNLNELITGQILTGKSDNNELFKAIAISYYLAIYYYNVSKVKSDEELKYLNTKFKVDKLFKCLNLLGIKTRGFNFSNERIRLYKINTNTGYTLGDTVYNSYLTFTGEKILVGEYFPEDFLGKAIMLDQTDNNAYYYILEIDEPVVSNYYTSVNPQLKERIEAQKITYFHTIEPVVKTQNFLLYFKM